MAMARYTYHGLRILRTSCPRHSFATNAAAEPPQAAADQIFRDEQLSRLGTSLGTEDEWQKAVKAQGEESNEDDYHGQDMKVDNASMFASNRLGQVVLPTPLIGSVNAMLKHSHGPGIRSTALRFYESLRSKSKGKTPETPMPPSKEFTSTECVAYIAGLMPQVYTSVYITLLELRKRLGEEWRPASVLDCGVGPGTAALAFQEVFIHSNPHPPRPVPSITIIEINDELRHRTEKLWSGMKILEDETSIDHVRPKIYHTMGSDTHKYDVVLAPHVLGDQKGRPSARDVLVRDLWTRVAPGGVLLLLERGNPMGFEQVARARQLILKSANQNTISNDKRRTDVGVGAHVITPCPHDGACPMFLHGHDPERRSWCHFSQRLQRPDFLQRTKHAKENIEDVNYSHVIIRKGSLRPSFPSTEETSSIGEGSRGDGDELVRKDIVRASYHWSRIILPPLKRHKHVLLDICSSPHNVLTDSSLADAPRITKHSHKKAHRSSREEEEEEEEEDVVDREEGEPRPILQRTTVPKSQGQDEYRFARRSHWGDLLPFRGKTMVDKQVTHQAVSNKQDIKKNYRRDVKERQRERREARESQV